MECKVNWEYILWRLHLHPLGDCWESWILILWRSIFNITGNNALWRLHPLHWRSGKQTSYVVGNSVPVQKGHKWTIQSMEHGCVFFFCSLCFFTMNLGISKPCWILHQFEYSFSKQRPQIHYLESRNIASGTSWVPIPNGSHSGLPWRLIVMSHLVKSGDDMVMMTFPHCCPFVFRRPQGIPRPKYRKSQPAVVASVFAM